MANPFLTDTHDEIETAIMLEKAYITDIGKSVAYADSKGRIFINTEDNLGTILPNYCLGMLKWLLWHERYHVELRHHNRFYKYLEELSRSEVEEKFQVTKEEVNIIMDILVHDSLSKMFPELVDIAKSNMAQMRNSNSLKYTFTTFTLEEMLDEYRKFKEDSKSEQEAGDAGDETGEPKEDETEETKDETTTKSSKKTHGESSHDEHEKPTPDKETPAEDEDETERPLDSEEDDTPEDMKPMHDDRDWSKLEDIDTKEFIDDDEADEYIEQINELKKKKMRIDKLTQRLNGLATSIKRRTYAMPSTIRVGKGIILKGRKPEKAELYLVFDASGSMGYQLETFKTIINKSIPQALKCPCEWFSGWDSKGIARGKRYRKVYRGREFGDYYKGTFQDIMTVEADNGYGDDGDRTIELCYLAEQAGYTPIGVTDGGGGISHSETVEMLKKLKKTIIVGPHSSFMKQVQEINPAIQTLIV